MPSLKRIAQTPLLLRPRQGPNRRALRAIPSIPSSLAPIKPRLKLWRLPRESNPRDIPSSWERGGGEGGLGRNYLFWGSLAKKRGAKGGKPAQKKEDADSPHLR